MSAKALSIQQPWAWAITDLDKRIENRTWGTKFRGEIFLHASKEARSILSLHDICTPQEMDRATEAWEKHQIPMGAIVGVAEIFHCENFGGLINRRGFKERSPRPNRWLEGPCAWMLQNVVKLPTPVPCKGAQGFWKVPPKVEAEVRRQLAMAKTEAKDAPPRDSAPSAVEAQSAHEDLGYTSEEWRDFTPDQRRALRKVFGEIEETKTDLGKKRVVQAEADEAADEAKEDVKTVREALNDLREQAEDIAAGRSKGELPGMDNASALGVTTGDTGTRGQGDAGTDGEGKPTDVCECGHPRSDHEQDSGACLGDGCRQSEDDGCQEFVLRNEPQPPTETIPADLHTKALDHVASAERKGKGLDANGLSMALFGNRKKEFKPRCEQILARLVADGDIVADENSEDGKPRYLPARKE